jgi:arsenate reductase-like glutaredoxin family protein
MAKKRHVLPIKVHVENKHFYFKNILCSTGEIAPDYEAYLQTNHWRTLRRKIYDLRKHKCQKCKKTISDYQVHHLSYARIGHELLGDLMLLCYDCHEKIHAQKSKTPKAVRQKQITREKAIVDILLEKQKSRYHTGKYYNSKEALKIYPVEIVSQ